MKSVTSIQLAEHPYAEQIIDTFNGFTIEICLRDSSMNTAFHLRYRSYLAVGSITENKEEMLYDEYDFSPNARIHLVWHEGKAVATIRSCVYSDHYNWVPTEGIRYFRDTVNQELGRTTRILESNRFAVDPDFQGRQSLFAQFLLFRAHGLNAGAHGCSHIITSVRSHHRAFYLRFLGMEPVSEQAVYIPWVDAEVYLLANETESCLSAILKRGMPDYDQDDISRYARKAQLPVRQQTLAA
ncbi:MAG: GNAT family N-acyltransferase [Saprospiraceae bacterium]|nr:GNAT family N-acetyltransferase [Lewinella sp.]